MNEVKLVPPRSEVYVDNATMVGVSQLICNPHVHLSAYTLLDLETFCEAFILYDSVISLRGQSDMVLQKVLNYDALYHMRTLFQEMRAAGIFSTRYATGDWLFEDPLISKIMGNLPLGRIPDPISELRVDGYNFKKGIFHGRGRIQLNRSTYQLKLSELIDRTRYYFAVSMYEGKPYMASSVRAPIARALATECKVKANSIIQKCMEIAEKPLQQRIEKAASEFQGMDLRLALPPLLKYVLEQCNEPNDIPQAILKTRNRNDVVRFREWCQKLQGFVDTGNVDELLRCLEKIKRLSDPFSKRIDSGFADIEALITITASPLSSILKLAKNNIELLISWIRNRHFVFIKRLSSSTICIERNRKLIENIFKAPLSAEELNTFSQLRRWDME